MAEILASMSISTHKTSETKNEMIIKFDTFPHHRFSTHAHRLPRKDWLASDGASCPTHPTAWSGDPSSQPPTGRALLVSRVVPIPSGPGSNGASSAVCQPLPRAFLMSPLVGVVGGAGPVALTRSGARPKGREGPRAASGDRAAAIRCPFSALCALSPTRTSTRWASANLLAHSQL